MTYTQDDLNEMIRLHGMWLRGEDGGVRLEAPDADLRGADLRGANLYDADLCGADLRGADLRGANLDYSCLPLWCGAKFTADARICKQLVAHVLRIMELSGEGNAELLDAMEAYKAGWHRENEFGASERKGKEESK